MILFSVACLYTLSTLTASSSSSTTLGAESKESVVQEIAASQILPMKGLDFYIHQVVAPESSECPIETRCSVLTSYCKDAIVGRTILVASSADLEKLTLVHGHFLEHIGDFRKAYCEQQDKEKEAEERAIRDSCIELICTSYLSERGKKRELISYIKNEIGSSAQEESYDSMSIDELAHFLRSQPVQFTSTFEQEDLSVSQEDLGASSVESKISQWLFPSIQSFQTSNKIEMTALAKTAYSTWDEGSEARLKKYAMSGIVNCSLYFCYRMRKSRFEVKAPIIQYSFGIPFSHEDYSKKCVGRFIKNNIETFLYDIEQKTKPHTVNIQAMREYLEKERDLIELYPAYKKGILLICLLNDPALEEDLRDDVQGYDSDSWGHADY